MQCVVTSSSGKDTASRDQIGAWRSFHVDKADGQWIRPSSPFCVDKNEWSVASTPPYFLAWCLVTGAASVPFQGVVPCHV
jgi:hypothetical protein